MRPIRFEQHLVVARVGNGAARRDGLQPGAFRGPQTAMNAVPVKERAPAVAVKGDHAVEVVAREVAIRPCASESIEELPFFPGLRDARRDDLLRQNVERRPRKRRAVEQPPVHGIEQCFGLGELIDREREDTSLWHTGRTVPGPTHALQKCGD